MVNLSNKVISSYKIVKGAKAGEKPRKPNIAVDSVSSISTAKILYGLNDGEISGIVGGGKGIKLEDTPLEDDNGNSNFEGVKWDFRSGTIDQEYIEGFPDISNETPVSVELKDSVAWVKSISNPVLSAVRIRLAWNGLKQQNIDNGDVSGYRIDYAIDLKTGSGAYTEVLNTNINDKVSGKYERTHRIELPKSANGWLIRVRRITPNANKENIQDKMFVESITEVIDQKFRYPHTSLLGIQYDAKTFSRIAKLAVRARGKLIKIPTNYNTTNNTYTGIWNGQFKLAYSNNPAWIFYDLVTSKRYGLGKRIDASMIDKWSLYELGTYCDALVDDGQGGKEKRYTCNVYIQSQVDAYKILSQLSGIFRGITYWNGQQLVISADVPKDPTYTFSRANVVDGNFEYTGTRARDRHTVAKVAFDNPKENFKTEYELVRDEAAIAKFGINILDISAIGCTSRGQAQRAGLWALKSEQLETRTVTFRTGLEGFNVAVGEVIEVSDELLAGRANGGRITAVGADLKTITLDRDAIVKVNDFITVNTKDGNSQRRKVIAVTGKTITLLTSFVGIDTGSVWAVSSSDLKTMQFRIMAIKPDENNIYTITAMQYEPLKYDAVDKGANVKPTDISINKPSNIVEAPTPVYVSANYRVVQAQTVATLIIQWSQVKDAVSYLVEWRKDSGNWIQIPATGNVSAEVDGVYGGLYQARVKAVNAIQASSTYAYSSITTVKSKLSEPKALINLTATGILFGITLNWLFSEGSEDSAYTEVEVATDDLGTNTALVGQFSYPTDNHTINGLQGNLKLFYRARTVDKFGNASEWTTYASATVDASADKVLDLLEGQITESQLYQDLRTKIDLSGNLSGDLVLVQNSLDTAKADIVAARTDIDANKENLIYFYQAVEETFTNVQSDITTLNNNDVAFGELVTALDTDYKGNKTSVNNALTVLSNKDIAIGQTLDSLTATVGTYDSAINELKTVTANNTSSIAQAKTDITAGYNTAISSLEIEGRNLLHNSDEEMFSWVQNRNEYLIYAPIQYALEKLKVGDTVTISFDVLMDKGLYLQAYCSNSSGSVFFEPSGIFNNIGGGEVKRLSFTTTIVKQPDNGRQTCLEFYSTYGTADYFRVSRVKIEKGNRATLYSKAPEDTFKAIDDIEIGGSNLLKNSNFSDKEYRQKYWYSNGGGMDIINDPIQGEVVRTVLPSGFVYHDWIKLDTDTEYTYSALVKPDIATAFNISVPLHYWAGVEQTNSGNIQVIKLSSNEGYLIPNEWQKIYITFKLINGGKWFRPFIFGSSGNLSVKYLKLEKGNKATDWTAAPEDIKQEVAAIQIEATATANKITGLYAQYTVKLDVGGRVSGFGLASTGKTSNFSINADNFYIAPPTGSSKGGLPFMVTNGTTINGISVPAGTYIRDAYIANGSIGTAKIGKLAVDSLQIADYAVSLPVYVDNPNQQNIGYGTSPVAGWVTIAKATFPSVGASATITLGIDSLDAQAAPQPNNAPYYSVYVGIFRNGVEMKRFRMTNYRSEVTGGFITKDTLLYFPTLMDTQKTTETVVYEAKVLGENFHIRGGGSWGSFQNFIRVGALSFTVMAMKK